MPKYNNKKTIVDGITFHSKKEAAYYCNLKLLKKAKKITRFEMQVPFLITYQGFNICKYICDFIVYYPDGTHQVVDVKGVKTSIYRLKKKLVKAFHGIDIVEV